MSTEIEAALHFGTKTYLPIEAAIRWIEFG